MSDKAHEIELINTPESLGIAPRFVLQYNAVSRSAHNFSAAAKEQTAISLLPVDPVQPHRGLYLYRVL
jgi:hypothetical protein